MRSRLALTLVLLAAGMACRAKEDLSAAPSDAKQYPLRGVVSAVDAARSEVTITHEEIPGYMAAMTMVFPVPNSRAVLERLRPGMEVQGTLVVEESGYRLEDLAEAPPKEGAAAKLATPVVHVVTPEPNRAVDVGDEVPDFALTDQTGKTVKLSQMRGEPLAVTFVYTRCPIATACPLTTAKFSKLDAMLRKEPAGRLFVITVEPEKDTPAVLGEYARKAGADPARWKFLTGSPQDVADVASRFGVLYYPERGQVIHTQAVAVVDPRGRLATIYYGENWEPEHLLRDMKKARDS
ncbi:MAG: SCO family protein [Thermoanaerobaculia bacterium]